MLTILDTESMHDDEWIKQCNNNNNYQQNTEHTHVRQTEFHTKTKVRGKHRAPARLHMDYTIICNTIIAVFMLHAEQEATKISLWTQIFCAYYL